MVFHDGVSLERIDDINAGIGATIVRYPLISTAYRIALPPGMSFSEAVDYYTSFDEVAGMFMGTNYCPD